MSYILIVLFVAFSAGLFLMGYSYQNGSRKLAAPATAPADDRSYWENMTKKLKKSYFIGAAGGVLAAAAVALKKPVPAEVGCITLMAALVFGLAILCRKTGFRPCEDTLKLQKRWKTILLCGSFAALLLTQFVFQYFLSLE